jgi:hypothetical protein
MAGLGWLVAWVMQVWRERGKVSDVYIYIHDVYEEEGKSS